MRVRKPRLLLVLLVTLLVRAPLVIGQESADAAGLAARQRAMDLFRAGKRLEALPLLEELARGNPRDSDVLVALAASLVEHAATLKDADATAKERFRARDLLQKAFELGNTSPLEENLRQILEELPASGTIKFSDNPAVQQSMSAGEAAFARRQFDEALQDYGQALKLEPTNYTAVLFTGNTYDKENNFARAADWYERAAKMNPDIETAYRYYADLLARQGDMAKARSMLIQAAVAEPYNRIVWREIRAWALINKTAFNIVYVGIPLPKTKIDPAREQPADLDSAWRAYFDVKSGWKKGGRFEKEFPQEREYRHSLPEESEALTAAANVLEKLRAEEKGARLVAADPTAGLLLKLKQTGFLDAYVLFSLGDEGIAQDYEAYRKKNRAKLEAYLDQFVMPPAPTPAPR